MNTACPACGITFTCNPGACWCEHLPILDTPEAGRGCYCANCLTALTAAQAADPGAGVASVMPGIVQTD